jgi:hypothetical protein
MTAFQYDVKCVDPSAVRADLVRVWTSNLPVEDQAQAKFDWIYRRAVQAPPGVFVLSARTGTEAPRVVGTAGMAVRSLRAGSQSLRAALLVDLAVDRDHRTVMPALRLVRGARAAAQSEFDLAYGFPNRQSRAVFLRCGYRELGRATRWARVLRHARYVHRVVPMIALSSPAGAILDAGNLALLAARLAPALGSQRLYWLEHADARFDRLWEAARGAYRLVGTRDAAFLRWRFLDQPGHAYQIAVLADRRSARELRAYAVVEREGPQAHIRDLFGHPGDLGMLLDLLLLALTRQGLESASFGYLGSDAMTRLLISRGFRRRESDRMVVYDVGTTRADLAALVGGSHSWHLTDADEDA